MTINMKKALGLRISSEANDLKRTLGVIASELELDEKDLQDAVNGDCELESTYSLIKQLLDHYPIRGDSFSIDQNDCEHGAKIMTSKESELSERIFDRRDRHGTVSPYYKYRDTAMSRLSPIRPEWIQPLRYVEDSDPLNPDVALNNGHFLHQMTFFIGPVNFYWTAGGTSHCAEMNTGDSNYIPPFYPHSFTSRSPDDFACIVAVTFGLDLKNSINDFIHLDRTELARTLFDIDNSRKATSQLIRHHMMSELMNVEILKRELKLRNYQVPIDVILDCQIDASPDDLDSIAKCFNISARDLMPPIHQPIENIAIRRNKDIDAFAYPSKNDTHYQIFPLVRLGSFPHLKAFDIRVLGASSTDQSYMSSTYHSYIFNYGDSPVEFLRKSGEEVHRNVLDPQDSCYIQPLTKHSFQKTESSHPKLLIVRVMGSLSPQAQFELSLLSSPDKLFDSKIWFN